MANTPQAGSSGNTPARADAQTPAPKIGELGYKFLHPVASQEGQEERRRHDTLYRQSRRQAARAVAATLDNPPPLRPTNPGAPGAETPGADSGGVASPGATGEEAPGSLPWEPELIADLLAELIEAAEENRVAQYAAWCKEANLLPKLCKEITDDAYFPKLSKKVLSRCLPRLAAKYLNKSGVSAEFQDEVAVFTAFLLIAWNDRNISKRLAEHAEKNKKPDEPVKPPTSSAPAPVQPVALPDPPRPPGAPPVVTAKPVSEQTIMQ